MGKSSKHYKFGGQRSYENYSNSNSSLFKLSTPKKIMKTSTYFSDPLLIPRINQYLSDNKDKVYVDINDMVNELQSRYREYGRRKRSAFKPLVERAFSFVLQQCGISQDKAGETNNYEESSENSSSDVEECNISDEEVKRTSSNNQLVNLYNASQLQAMTKHYQACSNENAELIDLSSDDENVKKKDGGEEKSISATKLKNLQSKIANKETTLTVVKAGSQNHAKVDRPNVTITAKRSRDSSESKLHQKSIKRRRNNLFIPTTVTFSDFGGDPKILEEVCKLILHISHPEIYRELGVNFPRGFLLHGPPGCGKTLLANAIAGELEVGLIQVSGPELVGGVSGESEERIRDLFDKAVDSAPCVLFIDEVDAICPNRQNAQKEMERRIVAQLLTCLDELGTRLNGDLVLVIGATNRPDSIDPALRRAGRFDREVCLGIPDLKAREKILRVMCSHLNLSSNFSYEELAQITPGFVGADLSALCREAAMVAINRVFGMLQTVKSKTRTPKCKRLKADKPSSSGEGMEKDKNESMEVDILEPSSSTDKPNSEGDEGSTTERTENENKESSEGTNKEKENGSSDKPKEDAEETKEDNIESTLNGVTWEESEPKSETSKEESKAGPSDDEIDVEVISDTAPNNPTLETLLFWLRDCSPLPYRQLKNVCITQDDFKQALSSVQPSAKREGFATVPDVTWDDVGSLADVREELKMSILVSTGALFGNRHMLKANDGNERIDEVGLRMFFLEQGPVKYRKQFEQLGLLAPAGILICGPPGCGKTLLAKAVANEAGVNFISVKGPELLNMYVGESERAVRRCFQRARNSAPCVIFFDELDALCPRRSDSAENGAGMRVVNQLLTEMDGVEDRKEVYLMAATNRPDIIDPAVLRPGRLDKIIYVGLPQAEDRVDILRALTKNGTRPKLGKDVSLKELAIREECHGYSGADLAALVREAGVQAVKELMSKPELDSSAEVTVDLRHFEKALEKIRPSVAPEDQKYYETIRRKFTASKT